MVMDVTQTKDEEIICLVLLSTMNLVSSLLKPQFLFPTSTYSFIEARSEALKLNAVVQPIFTWIRGCLLDADLGIASLSVLDL